LFISLIIYGFLYDIFALLDLATYIKNFCYVIANIMENMLVLMTVIKISVLRIKCIMINSTSEYKLLYKIKPLVKPYNVKSYVFDCIHEFLRIIMIISGYLGIHCFFASIGFHLIGQLAILNCKVKNVFNNTDGPRQGIRKIILGHHRLIRLADLFEDSFNIVIGQHLFRTTILLCIPRYRMLSSLAVISQTEGIITFSCDELYFCDWYELSTMDMKSIWICMMRCSKHLRLTCAKFCILSMRTFIDPSYFTFDDKCVVIRSSGYIPDVERPFLNIRRTEKLFFNRSLRSVLQSDFQIFFLITKNTETIVMKTSSFTSTSFTSSSSSSLKSFIQFFLSHKDISVKS
ncbi:odorant receptor 13a-like, partial [Vespula squamosa]